MFGDLAMSLLDHPEAQALLADAEVSPGDVRGCRDHITRFLKRYLPSFYRREQRGHAAAFVRGLLSGLERKSVEPIASQAGVPRKDLQYFVGCGGWDDDEVMAEVRRHVREELAQEDGVIVLDPSAFPKKGAHSCGVARQWCGRLGKKENCQVGVFLAYTSAKGHAPLDRRLYLPREWVDDPGRRRRCHVPEDVTYRKTWEIAHDLLRRSGPGVPHRWVVGDDEFGRASEFRAKLRADGERYLLDVPCNTNVRDLGARRPPRRRAHGGVKRAVPWVRVDSWARKLPADRWTRLTVRDGAKGPLEVEAVSARVRARHLRRIGPEEGLLVTRTVGPKPDWTYSMTDAPPGVPLVELVRARSSRHRVEEVFQQGKGEVGLAHYEVRSWVGWHHHVTLALLALWFLVLERRRLGGENPGGDRGADAGDLHRVAPQAPPDGAGDRRGGRSGLAA
jgi:SRSO17 transposase